MQSELSSDSIDIVRELTAILVRAADYSVPGYGDESAYRQAAFGRVRAALAEGGWNELLAVGAGGDEDIALIARTIEEVALKVDVLAFPLAENVVARRLLASIEHDDAASNSYTAVADLASVFVSAGEVPPTFAYPDLADTFLTVRGSSNDSTLEVVSFTAADLVPTAQSVDDLRPLATVSAGASGTVIGELPKEDVERLASELILLGAAELLGTADRLAAETRRHLSQREQFGQKLSGFQALRHRLADAFVQVETLRSLVWYASWVAGRFPERLAEYALLCKGQAAEVAWPISAESIQLYGGMGFTWEQGLQFPIGRIASRCLEAPAGEQCLEIAGQRSIARGSLTGLVG